jgi:kynurenine formamidase
MKIIDLTKPIAKERKGQPTSEKYYLPLPVKEKTYQGVLYHLNLNGMSGTYLDFPGHIEEFEDNTHAGNYPLDKLCMLDTTLIRLEKDYSQNREITAADLQAVWVEPRGEVLILHTLGDKNDSDFNLDTIPYFGQSAITWLMDKLLQYNIKIFAADVYEKRPDLQGIFVELFKNHIFTICCMRHLNQLQETYAKSCIAPLIMDDVTQIPCRFFVIEGLNQ